MGPGGKLRIAVVGLGRMGRLHLAHVAEMADRALPVALCDSRVELLEHADERYGVPTFSDLSEMLEKARPSALIIATPPASHPSLVAETAAHGVHIFCEKPLALTRPAALKTAEAVEKAGVFFQIAFQRRFDRAYRDAFNKIRDGHLGDLLTFKSIGRDAWQPNLEYARLEVSGGLLLDMAVHDFDLARWLMGSEVLRVSTEANNLLYPELSTVGDVDNAVVNLSFESGAIGNVEASRTGTYGYDIRTEVVGTRGAIYIGSIEDYSLVSAGRDGFHRRAVSGFAERFLDAYKLELKEFIDCVRDERPPECGLRDGILSLDIALAATESYRAGAPILVEGR